MALTVGNRYLASEFISLKARVKAEMLRRKYRGTLVSYGSSAYDYDVVPTEGGVVLPEHVNKIAIPLNAINNTGISEVASGDVIKAIDALDTFLTTAEGYKVTSSTTDCKSSCSGLCVTGCGSGCKGCSGCSGCGNACSSGCGSACSNSCEADNCDTGCKNTCYNYCLQTCKGECSTTCSGACSSGCKGTCVGGCLTTCSGCGGTCKGGCTGGLTASPV